MYSFFLMKCIIKNSSDENISTSKTPTVSRGFTHGDGYVYVIVNDGKGIDATGTIATNFHSIKNMKPEYKMSALEGFQREMEIFFQGRIYPENVVGYIEYRDGEFIGNLISRRSR